MGFRNPIVGGTNSGDSTGSRELIIPGITSDNYIEGAQGWRIGQDGSAQFQNSQILSEFGATDITCSTLNLAGQDLANDILEPLPLGLIAIGLSSTTVSTAPVSTETVMFTFNTGSLFGSRYYRIIYRGLLQGSVAGDVFDIQLRYTLDGTTPTVASPIFAGSAIRVLVNSPTNQSHGFVNVITYSPTSDFATVQFAVTLQRASGSGTGFFWLTQVQHQFQITVEDIGSQTGVAGSLSQISKSSGTSDPAPTATYTKVYNALWSRSYDGDGGTRAGDDSTHCYQGYYSGTHGNTRSLVGFDYTSIMAALSGATVNSVKLTFKVLHTYFNAGSTIEIGGHSYTTKPSTWSGANVAEQQTTKSSAVQGNTYTVTLPTSFGTNFKSGAWKGIAFGEAPSNSLTYYAYLAGFGDTGAPKLTITYTK